MSAMGEGISVPSRAMRLICPEFKEQRALEDEGLPELRHADTKQKPFQCIFRQKQAEFFVAAAREIRQPLPN